MSASVPRFTTLLARWKADMTRGRNLGATGTAAVIVIASMAAARSFAQTQLSAHTNARSIALFQEAGKVLQHPRCLNCHPVNDRPTQTDRVEPHRPWVVRGVDGRGAPGLPCSACHHAANSMRRRCREARHGGSRRPPWAGRVVHSARSARRSRIQRATEARTWRRCSITSRETVWSVGPGGPAADAHQRPGHKPSSAR